MADERVELEPVQQEELGPVLRPGYPRPSYPEGNYGYGYGVGEDRVSFQGVWKTIRKRKWMILLIAVIVTTIVAIEMYRTKSTYQSSVTVDVGSERATLVKTQDVIIQSDDTENIRTAMLLIKSRPLLDTVAAKLGIDQNPRFLDVNERKSFLEAIDAIASRVRQKTQGEQTIYEVAPTEWTDKDLTVTPEESAKLAPFTGVMAANLTVDPVLGTRALIITFTHTEPQIAAAIANGVAQEFRNRSFLNKTERYSKASDWLDTMTRKLQSQVKQAEETLANYTNSHDIFSTEGKETLTTDKLVRLHEQVLRSETDRIVKLSLYEEVRAGRVDKLPEAFTDTATTQLKTKLKELASEKAQLELKYGPENPRMKAINEQIEVLQGQLTAGRGDLEEKLKADYERSVREENSLKAALEKAKSEAAQQNRSVIEFSLLKQDVETSKSLYNEFLQKQSQAQIQVAEQSNTIRVIEPAQVPIVPTGPNRLRAIMIGLLLSLVAGIGLAFTLDYLDNTVKTVEDVARYAQLPALGIIPALSASSSRKLSGRGRKALSSASGNSANISSRQDGLVALENRSSAAEAYRVLRTSVLLSTAGSPPKTILVTSGQPGEGKTTTTVNTAISLAQLGASVLIIDCDLRKPSTHKVLGVDHSRGLSTYLSRNVELDSVIQKLQIPNLSVMPCGPIPPNPAELISSERMKKMLETLMERYDHILIDSPPLINVTDPVILSTMVDGVMLVVHGGKSTRDVVRRARQELTSVGAKIFGVVLNNIDLRREGYDDYYYYRYYSEYYGAEKDGTSN